MMTKINRQDFKYPDDELLPMMVLGIKHSYDWYHEIEPQNKNLFYNISHQSAGHACHQLYLSGMILEPQDHLLPLMKQLNNKYLDSLISVCAPLDSILEYREIIKKYGLDCKYTYHEFEEAIYPFDLPEDLSTICKDDLPKDLNTLIVPKEHFFLNFHHWNIYILGQNCD